MKVAFVAPGIRTADGLETAPLGGSESALLLAATGLAQLGADVLVASPNLPHETERAGIRYTNRLRLHEQTSARVDAVVTLNRLLTKRYVAGGSPGRPLVIHWHQNDALSPYGKHFADRTFYEHVDHFVFCSHFQANSYISLYGLPCDRVSVIPNPISPPFCNLFAPDEPVLAQKDPDLLVYASAPNRGLEGLLHVIFPHLRQARPSLRLEVYSGFYLDQGIGYQGDEGDTSDYFERLLAEHAAAPNVTIHRGVAKPTLAQRLRQATMLCYPCSFRETSCTVALEAMAAGCQLSTTTIGALPETTAGFAYLTPTQMDESLVANAFIANTLRALAERTQAAAALERRLQRQVEHVNRGHNPSAIARLWQRLLRRELHPARRSAGQPTAA